MTLASAIQRYRTRTLRYATAIGTELGRRPSRGRPHGLPRPLVVSLTSFPARYKTLHLTLKCLLSQTVQPDKVVLWLAEGDADKLPAKVRALTEHGLTVETCPDLRSYNKLVPSLRRWPDHYILTADDDLAYERRWVESLIERAAPDTITCFMGRCVPAGGPTAQPYLSWSHAAAGSRGAALMPLGGSGVLYPPGALDLNVALDETAFLRLAPTADDLWFYWMARRNDTPVEVVRDRSLLIEWPGVERGPRLFTINGPQGNDQQIAQLQNAYPL